MSLLINLLRILYLTLDMSSSYNRRVVVRSFLRLSTYLSISIVRSKRMLILLITNKGYIAFRRNTIFYL
jgi:hypothetical protein